MLDQEVMSRVAAYRGNPAPLQQRYAMSQNLIDLLALQKIKSEKEAAARQMQLQMAQQQAANGEAPMTVAQQREQEVMDMTKRELAEQRGDTLKQQQGQKMAQFNKLMGGLAAAPGAQSVAQPKAMAAGGIVAFAGPQGSLVDEEDPEFDSEGNPRSKRERERILAKNAKLREMKANVEGLGALRGQRMRGFEAAEAGIPERMEQFYKPRRPDVTSATQAVARPGAQPAPAVPAAGPASAGLAGLPGAVPARPAAPAAPGALAAPAAPGAGPLGAPAMAAPAATMIPGLQKSIEQDIAVDPAARQQAEEDRIAGKLAMSPEERKAMEEATAFRRRQFEEQYDPERQRREGLKQFLIGAGGRRYGEFGGGAQAGMAYDTAQRAAKLKEFEDMQKGIMEPFTKQREVTKMGIEGGLKGLEAASAQRRVGQTAGTNIYGTESQAATAAADRTSREREKALDREVEMAKVKAQNAATAASREGMDFSRLQGHLNTIITNRARAVEAVQKRFGQQLSMVDMGLQANPKDKNLLSQRSLITAEIEAEIDKVTRDFDEAKALVESRLYGKAGTGQTGGYTVRKKEPTK